MPEVNDDARYTDAGKVAWRKLHDAVSSIHAIAYALWDRETCCFVPLTEDHVVKIEAIAEMLIADAAIPEDPQDNCSAFRDAAANVVASADEIDPALKARIIDAVERCSRAGLARFAYNPVSFDDTE